jgi:GAF domain-containing protein
MSIASTSNPTEPLSSHDSEDLVDYDLSLSVAAAARQMSRPTTLEDTLSSICEAARDALPGFDAVGLSTIDRAGNVATRAGTSDLVWELDRLQYELAEGPCVESLEDKTVVMAPHIRTSGRWPRYAPAAVALGLRSQMGVKLYLDDEGTVGGLNMYSTTSDTIEKDSVGMAELFAAHAAIAMGQARHVETLQEALSSRSTISQAVGLLMQKYGLTDDAAFGLLVRTSSHANVKIRDIAAEMVDKANAEASR